MPAVWDEARGFPQSLLLGGLNGLLAIALQAGGMQLSLHYRQRGPKEGLPHTGTGTARNSALPAHGAEP